MASLSSAVVIILTLQDLMSTLLVERSVRQGERSEGYVYKS